jgi:HSP20 family protein
MLTPAKRHSGDRSLWSFDPGSFFRGIFGDEGVVRFPAAFDEGTGMIPRCDIHEEKGMYIVDAELPGVAQDEIEIRAHGHELEIEGEKRVEPRDEEKARRREIYSGRFYRRIRFAEEIDPSRTEASLVNGLLTVRLPQKAASSSTKIPIGKKRT